MANGPGLDYDALHVYLQRAADDSMVVEINQRRLCEELCTHRCTINRVINRMVEQGRLIKLSGGPPQPGRFEVVDARVWHQRHSG